MKPEVQSQGIQFQVLIDLEHIIIMQVLLQKFMEL